MGQTVTYTGFCTWQQSDSSGNIWEISGGGSGVWDLTITKPPTHQLLWQGRKLGMPGTLDGDTPEGVYVRLAGCDNTPSRTVSPPCNHMPFPTGEGCCASYSVLLTVPGASPSLDGLWILPQISSQFFWSSLQAGGARPDGAGPGEDMVIYSDGANWVLEVKNSDSCSIKFVCPMWKSPLCPPLAGWSYVDSGTPCVEPLISITPGTCPAAGTSSSSTSSLSSASSSSSSSISDVPLCNSPEQTFTWAVARMGEPFTFKMDPAQNSDTFLHKSSEGRIDISDPDIDKIVFDPASELDDVLMMYPASGDVAQVGGAAVGEPVSFRMPAGTIIFANTFGWFVHKETTFWHPTAQKTFIEDDGSGGTAHELVIPAGTPATNHTGSYLDFVDAGFEVAVFTDGISKDILVDRGFVDGDGILRFKFAHVICGVGNVDIKGMTCSISPPSSSSSPTSVSSASDLSSQSSMSSLSSSSSSSSSAVCPPLGACSGCTAGHTPASITLAFTGVQVAAPTDTPPPTSSQDWYEVVGDPNTTVTVSQLTTCIWNGTVAGVTVRRYPNAAGGAVGSYVEAPVRAQVTLASGGSKYVLLYAFFSSDSTQIWLFHKGPYTISGSLCDDTFSTTSDVTGYGWEQASPPPHVHYRGKNGSVAVTPHSC